MQLEIKKYSLPLRHTFRISRESRNFQDTMIISLSLNGKTGYGEATSSAYYRINFEEMEQEIELLRDSITSFPFTTPEVFYGFLTQTSLNSFARCALDLAAHDLYGKLLEKPLYAIWGNSIHHYPISNYTIGIDTIDKMIARIKEKPWPIYKIKLGTANDLQIIKQLRIQTDSIFRVDANGAWTPEETLKNAQILKNLNVEFIEQPLKADNWAGMALIKQECVLPVMADESCILETDVERCAPYYDGINIKLTKCGGLTPALRMIKKARILGLKVMVGCMTESTVGISAIAQLLPQLDYVDMDGAMLLKKDIAKGVQLLDHGKVLFPKLGGCGVQLL